MDENNVNNQEGQLYVVGTRGYSAYEVAVLNGYTGTEEEWLASLQGERGPQGEEGPQGNPGPTGLTPSIRVGSVTTGEPNTNVIITITGTPEVPIINFTIPKGAKGDPGGGGSTESDVFVVTGTAESPMDLPTIDKNIDEILSAYTSGKVVIFNGPYFSTFLSLGYDAGGEYMQGDYFEVNISGKLVHTHIKINSDGYSDTINQYNLTKSS